MPQLIMTKGLPGSGKTTWAREKIAKDGASITRVNKDDLRAMMHSGVYSKGNERLILEARDALILAALGRGHNVIVDDTNLAPKHAERLKQLAHQAGASFHVQDFTDIPLLTALEQNLARPNPVPEKVIRDMWTQFLKPEPDLSWQDDSLPSCLIVDLDGTLAHMVDRGPFEWDKVGTDAVDWRVRDLIAHYSSSAIVILSGRDGSCQAATLKWLGDHSIWWDDLFMRAEGDNRPDFIVKRELFDNHIRGKWNPVLVLDDRQQVVDMWRNDLGLVVWQVAEGNF